jgi:hypothetical protein
MKTQEEIDKVRTDYKKQWDVDTKRMEAKREFYQANLDAVTKVSYDGILHISSTPGELFPGLTLRTQIAELEENIAYRKLQWELIQDDFDAADKIRAS